MTSPDLDHLIDKLPQLPTVYVLTRDDGGQYDRNSTDMAGSTSKEYIERLKEQMEAAELEEQMPEAVRAWRKALIEKGVPSQIAEELDQPSFNVLADGFEFFKSYWHIGALDMIDAEKALRREAMLARASSLEVLHASSARVLGRVLGGSQ